MKKIFSFLLGGFFISVSLCVVALAAETELSEGNITALFEGSALFGYDSSHNVTVKSMSNSSIVLESPILTDDLDETIEDYVVLYGLYSFSELASNPALLTGFSERSFSSTSSSATKIEMTIDDRLDENKVYYAVVIPSDKWGMLGNISNEVCFRLKDQIYGEGQDCVNGNASSLSSTATHTSSSWKSAIELANISCTWDGKRVTFNWSPTDIGNVRISLYNERTNEFDIKGTINASQQRTFSFDVTQNTAPIARWDDTEGLSAYKTYTCHQLTAETTTKTTTGTSTTTPTKVTTVPTVGPKENVLAILIGAVVLYLVYVILRRKAD